MKFLTHQLILAFLFATVISCDDSSSNNTNNTNNVNNTNNTNNTEPYCGNNIVEGDEECDDGNRHSNDGCSADCQLEYTCGDGIVEYTEVCDTTNLDGKTCVSEGYLQGELLCTDNCTIDAESCTSDATGTALVGWYKMDSLSGQEENFAGTNNLCLVHSFGEGAVLRDMPGKIGSSIFFDGSFDLRGFMDCGPGYYGMEAITVEAWIEVASYPSSLSVLVASSSTYDSTGLAFYMGINGNFKLEASVGSWDDPVESTSNIGTSGWNHVAFTYDGSNISLYINGHLDSSSPLAIGPVPTLPEDESRVFVGSNYIANIAENDHFYTGYIDEIKVWTEARSEQEICEDAGGKYQNNSCEIGF
ncbi:MAG: LamG-like jellyroll fold domain-containing protein [Myxococcota bacterium]